MFYTPAVTVPGLVAHTTELAAIEFARLMKTYVFHEDTPRVFVYDWRPKPCECCPEPLHLKDISV